MKVKQIVGEHKKGFRAKKYARKPTNTIAPKKPEPIKPQGPASADVKEEANVMVKPITGAQEIDVNGQKIATATDATAAQTIAQLAKDGKIAPTAQSGSATTNPNAPMEEGPETPYFVDTSSGTPMAKTGGSGMTQIVPSKMWTAITPEIEAKAQSQGFRKVMLQMNNKQYTGLEGGDQALGSKIIVAPSDYDALKAGPQVNMRKSMGVQSAEKTGIGAPPMRESDAELARWRHIAGL